MKVRTVRTFVLFLVIAAVGAASADAGVIHAIIDKHKSNPETLHNKIKHKKNMNGGHLLHHGHGQHGHGHHH